MAGLSRYGKAGGRRGPFAGPARRRTYLLFAYAAASVFTRPSRLPRPMFASARCSPHCAFGEGVRFPAPALGATRSTLAPPAVEQRPVKLRDSTHGALAAGPLWPRTAIPAAIVEPGANGVVGMIPSRIPLPPRRDAGFVHSTWSPFCALRPNRLAAGGVWL